MRSFRKLLGLVFFVLVFGAFVFFYRDVIQVFFDFRFFTNSFLDRAFNYQAYKRIELENKILREEILRLRQISKNSGENQQATKKEVDVFSNYPFNDKDLIVINFGSRDGAKIGMPVFTGDNEDNVLVGKIVALKNTQSEVRTVYDPSWVSGVVVGGERARAVLKGGEPPRLELVPQEVVIKVGDLVFNTSPEFPLGAVVASVEEVKQGTGRFWSRIIVKPLFFRENLTKLFALNDFP